MNQFGQSGKQVLCIQKQFECAHFEQAVLAGIYKLILPEIRGISSDRLEKPGAGRKTDCAVNRCRRIQAIGGCS
jgi:hypothetical protein